MKLRRTSITTPWHLHTRTLTHIPTFFCAFWSRMAAIPFCAGCTCAASVALTATSVQGRLCGRLVLLQTASSGLDNE